MERLVTPPRGLRGALPLVLPGDVAGAEWRRLVLLALEVLRDRVVQNLARAAVLEHLHVPADLVVVEDPVLEDRASPGRRRLGRRRAERSGDVVLEDLQIAGDRVLDYRRRTNVLLELHVAADRVLRDHEGEAAGGAVHDLDVPLDRARDDEVAVVAALDLDVAAD